MSKPTFTEQVCPDCSITYPRTTSRGPHARLCDTCRRRRKNDSVRRQRSRDVRGPAPRSALSAAHGMHRCPDCECEHPFGSKSRWVSKRCDDCSRAAARTATAAYRQRNQAKVQARYAVYNQQRREGLPRRAPEVGDRKSTVCIRCSEAFEYNYRGKSRTVCDLCRRYNAAWSTYRLTGAQARALRARGCCDICRSTTPGGRHNNWHIDHDHVTGAVRGVLCAKCNAALGLFGDDPVVIVRAAHYLEQSRGRLFAV